MKCISEGFPVSAKQQNKLKIMNSVYQKVYFFEDLD